MASLVSGWLDLVSATEATATDRDRLGMSATDEAHFLRVRRFTHGLKTNP